MGEGGGEVGEVEGAGRCRSACVRARAAAQQQQLPRARREVVTYVNTSVGVPKPWKRSESTLDANARCERERVALTTARPCII